MRDAIWRAFAFARLYKCMSVYSKLYFRFQCSLKCYSYKTESSISREALRQRLDDLYKEISDCKISVENFENHPSITSQIIAKNPVANLRIPAKLFVLWSELKSIQVPTPTCVDLVRCSLKDNSGFTMFPNVKKLEDRLRKEYSRTCKKYRGLRWDYSKERLGESEKCVIVYANEGTLQLPNYQPSPKPSTADGDYDLVPKLRING